MTEVREGRLRVGHMKGSQVQPSAKKVCDSAAGARDSDGIRMDYCWGIDPVVVVELDDDVAGFENPRLFQAEPVELVLRGRSRRSTVSPPLRGPFALFGGTGFVFCRVPEEQSSDRGGEEVWSGRRCVPRTGRCITGCCRSGRRPASPRRSWTGNSRGLGEPSDREG